MKEFPKCSPDLNANEGWWKKLRDALLENAPAKLEMRERFIKRLLRLCL